MSFQTYPLQDYLLQALKDLGFFNPTPIQELVIPRLLKGQSLIAQSQTGSGKSYSFLLPLLSKVNPQVDQVQLVITAPSRELALQLSQVTKELLSYSPQPISLETCIGGTDKARQVTKLQTKQPQVVIGTPGRIFDLMKENALFVQTCSMFVVDEADMTFDLGFLPIVDEIASRMPKKLQMSVFSATIPDKIKPFLNKYMGSPEIIQLQPKDLIADTIENQLLITKGQDPKELLYQITQLGHPYLMVIFVNTKQMADQIAAFLREKGLRLALLHGDVPARERRRIMKQIQNMEYQFVVATDLAARGIDIEGISHVVNFEIPNELEFFIHRVGRTGRKGLKGTALTFYQPDKEEAILQLEAKGLKFTSLVFKDGQLQESYDRSRRQRRKNTQESGSDARVVGMIKKAKKDVKPGYKKKLNQDIKAHQKMTRKKEAQGKKKPR